MRQIFTLVFVAAFLSCDDSETVPENQLMAEGLKEPVEIIRDKWGINHIYAKNQHDLFFAQGYTAA
ncbi:MAG: penicillin acylase family protein, partial [Bacteroidota bacterium]